MRDSAVSRQVMMLAYMLIAIGLLGGWNSRPNYIISPDSRRFAFTYSEKSKVRIVVDGDSGKKFDGVTDLIFSPDSKHLHYLARNSDGEVAFVLDGKKGKIYADID